MKVLNTVFGSKISLATAQILSKPNLRRTLLCGVLFQLAWFVCILGVTWMWLLYGAVFLFFYATFISSSRADYIFAFIVASIGCSIDFLLSSLRVFEFPNAFIPLWLVTLWFLFALSMPYAFTFLRKRYVLAALVGGLGGSSSYFTAISLRADVSFMQPAYLGFLVLAVYWAVLLPTALALYEYFIDRRERDFKVLNKPVDSTTWL